MTEREIKLELAQQYSDFGNELVSLASQLLDIRHEITQTVKAMIAEIDVLLKDVREEDDERRAKRHYH